MRPRLHPVALLVTAALPLACGGGGPDQVPPTAEAEAAVARYVEALGGLDAVRAIDGVRKTGIYIYNGLEHPLTVLQERGGKLREEIVGLTQFATSVQADTLVVRAFDGDDAWMSVGGEVDDMPEELARGFELDADLEGPLVGFREKGHSVVLVGPTEVEGVEAIQIDLTLADGQKQSWYLDAETHLPLERRAEIREGEFQAAQTWYFDDYREVAGVQMPFYVMVEEMLFTREYVLDEIEANVEIDDALFAEP